jgi:hypothetical protein
MLRSHIILNDFELLMTFGSIGIHESHMKLNGPKKKVSYTSPRKWKVEYMHDFTRPLLDTGSRRL